jgi:hypothetical protein
MWRTRSALPDVGRGVHMERRRAEVVRPGAAAVWLPLVHEQLGKVVVEAARHQPGPGHARGRQVLLPAARMQRSADTS